MSFCKKFLDVNTGSVRMAGTYRNFEIGVQGVDAVPNFLYFLLLRLQMLFFLLQLTRQTDHQVLLVNGLLPEQAKLLLLALNLRDLAADFAQFCVDLVDLYEAVGVDELFEFLELVLQAQSVLLFGVKQLLQIFEFALEFVVGSGLRLLLLGDFILQLLDALLVVDDVEVRFAGDEVLVHGA